MAPLMFMKLPIAGRDAPQEVIVADSPARLTLRLEELVGMNAGLFEQRSKRSLGHVPRMVRHRGVSADRGVVPDFVTARGLSIKLES